MRRADVLDGPTRAATTTRSGPPSPPRRSSPCEGKPPDETTSHSRAFASRDPSELGSASTQTALATVFFLADAQATVSCLCNGGNLRVDTLDYDDVLSPPYYAEFRGDHPASLNPFWALNQWIIART